MVYANISTMHELSIITELVRLAGEKAAEAGMEKVRVVEMEAGEMTALVPELMRFAFEQITRETICEDAQLLIHMRPLVVRCRACNHEWEPAEPMLVTCPVCAGNEVDIVGGTEVNLLRLEGE